LYEKLDIREKETPWVPYKPVTKDLDMKLRELFAG
jgi:hypothetical protein